MKFSRYAKGRKGLKISEMSFAGCRPRHQPACDERFTIIFDGRFIILRRFKTRLATFTRRARRDVIVIIVDLGRPSSLLNVTLVASLYRF